MEYVENVVKAPKKPTFKINLISSDTSIEELCIVANDIPITSPPIRLTASVPWGKDGSTVDKKYVMSHLNQAPKAAARPTNIKFEKVNIVLNFNEMLSVIL